MALAVLEVNVRPGWSRTPSRPVTIAEMAGGGSQRSSLYSRTIHSYTLPVLLTPAEYAALYAFFEAAGWSLRSFLWKDIAQGAAERGVGSPGLVPLTALGSDVYQLPLTGTYGGDYPIDDVNVKVWDSLSAAQTIVATDTDARTIGVTAGGTGPMLADYHFYRRVNLVPGPFVDPIVSGLIDHSFELQEMIPHA